MPGHDSWSKPAGELLAVFHAQTTGADDDYERRANEKSLAWLSGPHRIAPDTVERLRAEIAGWPTPAATLIPTHGDWQPRNWLVHDGVVSVIDFGRAAIRPAMTDFARLAVQDFLRDLELEAAFSTGTGPSPRAGRCRCASAPGTLVWPTQSWQLCDPAYLKSHRCLSPCSGRSARAGARSGRPV